MPDCKGSFNVTRLLSRAVACLTEYFGASFISWEGMLDSDYDSFQYGALGQNSNSVYDVSQVSVVNSVTKTRYVSSVASNVKKKFLQFDTVEFVKMLLLEKHTKE